MKKVLLAFLIQFSICSNDYDLKLDLVKKVYDLNPKSCSSSAVKPERLIAGKRLFESKSLSGNRDISCKNCHLEQHAFADGLPISIGVGGIGEGEERLQNHNGVLVQRNSFSLVGRGHPHFSSFFWDGKAQSIDNNFVSQYGIKISSRFKSLLSLAATLPLVERDEFLGKRANAFKVEVGDTYYQNRYNTLSKVIRARLIAAETKEDKDLAKALKDASIDIEKLELFDIGELLADHIRSEFKCRESNWDKYLNGDRNAITFKQKKGALIFFGKGRCASCHSGELFSDMEFHSLGVPQGGFGPHSRHRDLGRAGVTNEYVDMFKFRTPPLINVRDTAPYGHNGVFDSLRSVVVHHFNPIEIYLKKKSFYDKDFFRTSKLIQSRSDLLGAIEISKESELEELIEFLKIL